jgi:ATP phosphoribosyltransferase regulatory subunit
VTARLPPGARDYLPEAAARRRAVAAALTAELARWGYEPVIPPLIEYDEVLARGRGGAGGALRLVEPSTGEVLAVRPDITPQIARIVATRLHDRPGPLRLFYEGGVVRLPQGELVQIGAELIDAPQAAGDLEMALLARATLAAAGVGDALLDLGHAGVARAAFDGVGDETREVLYEALRKKDAVATEAALEHAPKKNRALLAALPSLYGGRAVLQRARKVARGLGAATAALDELEALCDDLSALGVADEQLGVDLGEVRGFDYYTGTRFQLFASGAGGALASGGRYDGLSARYGRSARSTGFAVDVDAVAKLQRHAPAADPGVIVVGERVAAARLAERFRKAGVRAVVALDGKTPAATTTDLVVKPDADFATVLARLTKKRAQVVV